MEIEFIDPFKIVKFTIDKSYENADGSVDTTSVTYEIPPGEMNPSVGWIDYTPDSFDDPDIKAVISLAMNEWTPEVRAAYKAHVMETYVPPATDAGATLSYDQIDALLNEIVTADGAIS